MQENGCDDVDAESSEHVQHVDVSRMMVLLKQQINWYYPLRALHH
jgi:hypothetical protein